MWVNKRIRVALKLNKNIADALDKGTIYLSIAEIIATLDDFLQESFLLYISQNNILVEADIRKAKKRFQNNTIYTIGVENRLIQNLINILKENKIEYIIDTRQGPENSKDPNYTKENLQTILEKEKIHYTYNEELTVNPEIQFLYDEGAFPVECYERYYRGKVLKILNFITVVDGIKESGKTVLMGYKQYAVAQREQKTNCYRNILATRLKETGEFKEIIHL